MTNRILLATFLTVFLPVVAAAQPATRPDTSPMTFGVCTHFVQRKGLLEENLRLIKQAGVESIRDEVPWAAVEREKGVLTVPERVDAYVDAALAEGLEVVLVLDYGNGFYEKGKKPKAPESIAGFVRYATFVAEHFAGRVSTYEVWNEWDIGIGTATGEKGTPQGYMNLLKPTYAALKALDSSLTVVGGAVSPHGLGNDFFETLVGLGLADHCDAVSVHPYLYAAKPAEKSTAEACFDRLREFDRLLREANGGEGVPLLVTEIGWPTHEGRGGSSPQRAADQLARLHLLVATLPAVRGLWWYDFQNDGWNPKYNEDNFGLVKADLTPKPAYHALADVVAFLKDAEAIERLSVSDAKGRDDIYLLRATAADGGTRLAAWTTGGDVRLVLTAPDAGPDLRVELNQVGRPAVVRQWVHREWVKAPEAEPRPELAIVIGPTPTIVKVDRRIEVEAEVK